MEKVRRTENGCWQWTEYLDSHGYARLWVNRKNVGAHRWSYEHHVGPIPEGLQIDHLCRNRSCVNPEHLEAVTPSVNVRRGVLSEVLRLRAEARTHCRRGHEYAPENLYLNPHGERACLACKRRKAREYYERNRDLVIQRTAAWHAANPERARELSREGQRRYRAKKKAA